MMLSNFLFLALKCLLCLGFPFGICADVSYVTFNTDLNL